jgi:PIN domain nuclease of toxin-antitoxin system
VGSGEVTLLLDTHVLIWFAEGNEALPESSIERIDGLREEQGLAVSAINFWEVAMLQRRKRVSLSVPISQWRSVVLEASGITEAPLTGEIAIESVELPGDVHSDPADRMLIATARLNGWTLATRDDRILRYGKAGHVSTMAV